MRLENAFANRSPSAPGVATRAHRGSAQHGLRKLLLRFGATAHGMIDADGGDVGSARSAAISASRCDASRTRKRAAPIVGETSLTVNIKRRDRRESCTNGRTDFARARHEFERRVRQRDAPSASLRKNDVDALSSQPRCEASGVSGERCPTKLSAGMRASPGLIVTCPMMLREPEPVDESFEQAAAPMMSAATTIARVREREESAMHASRQQERDERTSVARRSMGGRPI